MKKIGIIVLVITLAVAGSVVLLTNKAAAPNSESTGKTTQSTDTVPESTNVIAYSDSGFSPSATTVKSGAMLTIKNNSTRVLQFESDPHPQHTGNPELNVGAISPGSKKTVTVTRTGTFGFHNHPNSNDTGTLIVE